MLWGGGTVDAQDAQRLKSFSQISTAPPYVLGFEEPDCPRGSGSADMSVAEGVEKWESLMAPMKWKGAKLGSPSMCSGFPLFCNGQPTQETEFFYAEQLDETWLVEFKKKAKTDWDFTAVHVNKNNLDGVKKVVVRI